ncbi:hypothetical protein PVT67_15535 [Gallaecimonas kandeliae]|uniref:hypothetical protein n=1 Tax=Gallaecimonas kandeliae TaxID=3029055 RepID=UPI002649A071|nr:hypothetical protein [Gallaecimonas kandeliae]WKE65055.1 hypothetical protein PVT67_15535 [Gallaecimonas kandeliae]
MIDIAVEVDGDGNKVAGRDYVEVNYQRPPPLTKEHRKELNRQVQHVAEAIGLHPAELWRKLHYALSVDSVKEMHRDHVVTVQVLLSLVEQNHSLRRSLRAQSDPYQVCEAAPEPYEPEPPPTSAEDGDPDEDEDEVWPYGENFDDFKELFDSAIVEWLKETPEEAALDAHEFFGLKTVIK